MVVRGWGPAAAGLLIAGSALAEDPPIGEAVTIVRDVTGTIGAKSGPLKAGDGLLFQQVIAAGDRSAATARFIDATMLTVGANARVTLDAFVFDPKKPALAATMTGGVLRFVTGTMDSNAYQVSTPTAAIGVRGTVFDLIVAPDGATLVYVEEGSVQFANQAGAAVTVAAGLASTIDAQSGPPSPPQPPAPGALAPVVAMTTLVALNAAPAAVLPEATADAVAALTAAAAAVASETDAASPGGRHK
jgi:hypothetical protein